MSIAIYDDDMGFGFEGLGEPTVFGKTSSLVGGGLTTTAQAVPNECPRGEQTYYPRDEKGNAVGARCLSAGEVAAGQRAGWSYSTTPAAAQTFYSAPVPTGWATGAGLQINPALTSPLNIPGVTTPGMLFNLQATVPGVLGPVPGGALAGRSFLDQYGKHLAIGGLVLAALAATAIVAKATRRAQGRPALAGLAGAGKQRFYRAYGKTEPRTRREGNMLKKHWYI